MAYCSVFTDNKSKRKDLRKKDDPSKRIYIILLAYKFLKKELRRVLYPEEWCLVGCYAVWLL
jgi:hypothetical protein